MSKLFTCITLLLLVTGCDKNNPAEHHQAVPTSEQSGLMLSDSQIRLANITTQKVSKAPIGESISLNGRLTIDEQESQAINSRAAGRIEKLYIKETGRFVEKGQPLYVLYSETLSALQQEYFLAKDQYEALGKTETRYRSFFEAAERKLLLYGMTKKQVLALDKTSMQASVVLLAPASGIVTEINVSEGQYVGEGTLLYKIENVKNLWVEAELYPDETAFVENGDTIKVEFSTGSSADAMVFQLTPEFKAGSQVTLLRAGFRNPELLHKPGEQIQVHLTHSTHDAITLPADAIIRDSYSALVYIQTEKNTFEPRMVKTGLENFERIEISEGLKEGEIVVVTGAYLIYSEAILKNGSAMANHNH